MTEELHPMVPPNILLNNWESDWFAEREHADVLLIQAYQAGADAELEACCKLLELSDDNAREYLQSARRPKPSPFQEQSVVIAELEDRVETLKHQLDTLRADYLRMANAVANQLPDRAKFFVDFMKDAS